MYYGWRVVAGTFTAQMFVVGFFSYAVSLFTPFLREDFGVSLEQVMYGMTIGTLAGLVLSPVAGALVDRVSVRWLMAAGSALFGLGLLLMARSETIWHYVWIFGITMAVANCFANTIPSMAVVSRWFTANRGRALGVAAIGTSVGGMLLPALVEHWLSGHGWRTTFDYLAATVLLVMLPASVLLVRGRPEDVGLAPEPDLSQATRSPDVQHRVRDVLGSSAFWTLGGSLGLTMAAYAAVLANLAPYALAAGATESRASGLILAVAVCGLIGKLVFGAVADRFNLKHGLWAAQSLAVIAFLLFAQQSGYAVMLLGACSMGFAAGGLLPVWGAILAKIFGLRSYGLAMGLISPLVTVCILPSFVVLGRLVDTTGGFRLPMLLFAGITAVAAVILLALRMDSAVPAGAADS